MNKITFNLVKLYFKQMLFSQFERLKNPSKNDNKFKNLLRQIGFAILIIYGFGVMLSGWGFFSFTLFKTLKSLGNETFNIGEKVLNRADLTSIVMTFFTVTISLLNIIIVFFSINYFLNATSSEEYLLTLPIKNSTLFSSKVIVISILNGLFFILMNLIFFFIYGFLEKVTIDYYILFIFYSVFISLFASLIAIGFSLLLVNIFKFLKNKDLMTYLSIFIFLPLVIAYNIFYQNMLQNSSNLVNSFLNLLGKNYRTLQIFKIIFSPIFLYFNYIIETIVKEKTALRFLHFLIQSGILAVFYAIIVEIFSPIFKNILLMTNVKSEKIAVSDKDRKDRKDNKNKFKEKRSFISLLNKEILTTYREPTYFLNGPFVIILMPLILGITLYFQAKSINNLDELFKILLSSKGNINILCSILVAASFMIGDFSNITSTAVSREGRSFSIMKSLPIKSKEYIFSKIFHGLILTFFGCLIVNLFALFFIKLNFVTVLLIFFISLLFSILFHIISISLDINKPKLNWDNPIIAMKQNLNAVYAVFIAMGLAVLLFLQTKAILEHSLKFLEKIFVEKKTYLFYLNSGLVLVLILCIIECLIIYLIFFPKIVRQYYEIEI